MKTKITLALFGLFLFMNGIKALASSLTIDLRENFSATYFITLNNSTTYQSFDDLIINDLPAGQHQIKITKQVERQRRRGFPYMQEVVAFDGFINIPPRANVKAQLRQRNLFITEVIQQPITLPIYPNRPRGNRTPLAQGMAPSQFNNLLLTVRNESFDSGKLSILESVLATNYFTSAQILDLMSLLSFDSGKLKVAQMGYRNTIDKGNYFIVNNGLSFSSSKRKLNEFIQSQGM